MRPRFLILLAVLLFAGCSPYSPCIQTEADPVVTLEGLSGIDDTFGVEGRSYFSFEDLTSRPKVESLASGKVLVAGGYVDGLVLARVTSSGGLDSPFGINGVLKVPLSFQPFQVVRTSQRSVAIGISHTEEKAFLTLAAVKDDGSVDLTFGSAGVTRVEIPNDPKFRIRASSTNKQGQIALAAQITGNQEIKLPTFPEPVPVTFTKEIFLYRFSSTGNLDTTFGDGGIVHKGGTEAALIIDTLSTLFLGANGSITLGGDSFDYEPLGENMALFKFQPNGEYDLSFGLAGRVTTKIAHSSSQVTELKITDEGRLLALVRVGLFPKTTIALVRFLANGKIDRSFGRDGVSEISSDGAGVIGETFIELADQRFLVGGSILRERQSPVLNENACTWLGYQFPQREWAYYVVGKDGLFQAGIPRSQFYPGIGGRDWASARTLFELANGRILSSGNRDRSFVITRLLPFP